MNNKIFISYAHGASKKSKRMIIEIKNFLKSKNYCVIFDEDDLKLGEEIKHFIENGINESKYILVMCTKKYKVKADKRKIGVGYEVKSMTTSLDKKCIPILLEGSFEEDVPDFLKGIKGIDFTKEKKMEEKLIELDNFLSRNS